MLKLALLPATTLTFAGCVVTAGAPTTSSWAAALVTSPSGLLTRTW
jgi:hypothetical protein